MKSKWFTFNGKEFSSKRVAKTEDEAWDKTLEKWGLMEEGYSINYWNHSSTCGLCNMYINSILCKDCPLQPYYNMCCDSEPMNLAHDTNLSPESINIMILSLLLAKEASK